MLNRNRFNKCLDMDSNSKKESRELGLMNPYGYSFDIVKKEEITPEYIKTCYDDISPSTNSNKKKVK